MGGGGGGAGARFSTLALRRLWVGLCLLGAFPRTPDNSKDAPSTRASLTFGCLFPARVVVGNSVSLVRLVIVLVVGFGWVWA